MIAQQSAIEVTNLSFSYTNSISILHDLSFSVRQGEILVLLGRNGSGKTTLLNCLLGHTKKYHGTIKINGIDLKTMTPKARAMQIGYVPQLSQVQIGFSVLDFMLMGFSPRMRYFDMPTEKMKKKALSVLEQFSVESLRDRAISSLSGGERQIVYIARTIAQDASIIVMDEPTSALDYGNVYKILQLIDKLQGEGRTIILTCHNPDYPLMLKNSSTLVFMPEHSYQYGKSSDLLSGALLSSLYGVEITRVYIDEKDRYVCL